MKTMKWMEGGKKQDAEIIQANGCHLFNNWNERVWAQDYTNTLRLKFERYEYPVIYFQSSNNNIIKKKNTHKNTRKIK